MQAMYYHYVNHGLRPSEYYAMGQGEKVILRAFMLQELKERQENSDRIEKELKGGGAHG